MKELVIVIPAIKKNVAFADDLVKKIHGITLIQRAINTAHEVVAPENIFVATDSKEINLICERNLIHCFLKPELRLTTTDILHDLQFFLLKLYKHFTNFLILFPYCPTIVPQTILTAYEAFKKAECDVMISVKEEKKRIFFEEPYDFRKTFSNDSPRKLLIEARAFAFFKAELIKNYSGNFKLRTFPVDDTHVEITNYQDWWVCEKLLKRKRIIFRVIGNTEVGMGHIFRSLSLAHEISDHEVIFVCDEQGGLAIDEFGGLDYLYRFWPSQELIDRMFDLKPDLVINDILNTKKEYIFELKTRGVKVVNFEDLGTGAQFSDLTFNELYDEKKIPGENIRWGHPYSFLRDEFNQAKPKKFSPDVRSILITFGGTDPKNLTQRVLETTLPICRKREIQIFVVIGGGYIQRERLETFIKEADYNRLELVYSTGVMSKIMEKSDVAICSNGRTVYELCHMHIPSIVIAQHERESTHTFAQPKNGFENLGVFEGEETLNRLVTRLGRLISNRKHRYCLHLASKRHNFARNKSKVLREILSLIER